MALTQQQIAELRKKYNIPQEGFSKPNVDTVGRANLGELQNAWGTTARQEPQGAFSTFTSGVTEAFKERSANVQEEAKNTKPGFMSSIREKLRGLGQSAGFFGDVGFEAMKLATPKPIEEIASKGVEKIAETDLAQGAFQKYSELQQKYPEAMKDLEAVFNIGSVFPALKGAQVGVKALKEGGEEVAKRTAKRVTGMLDERRLANIDKLEGKVDETVGRIIQGKGDDIEQAKRALSEIDTSGVKTYEDLNMRIEDQVEALSRKLDTFLDEQPGVLKPGDLDITTKVGGTTVKQNFVKDSLDQLEELYLTTKDAPSVARIQNLKNKLETEGLTRREINDLARDYGGEFGRKAFGKTGDPLTSVNAQAYENTRKGLKESFRRTIDGDLPKEIDSKISDLLQTSRLTKKMEDKVNGLYQKIKKRGLFEKVSNKLGTAVDVATFRTLSGFVSRLLPSNVGLKTMNSLDIEQELGKNLKKLEKMLESTSDDEVVKTLSDMMKTSQGGFIKNPLAPKQIDNLTKDEMIEAIDYIRLKKPFNQKMEENIGFLADKFGIDSKNLNKVSDKLENLVNSTKTKDISGRKVNPQ